MGATSKPVARRYCDEPMARSKGLIGPKQTSLPKCNKKCETCLACVEIDTEGNKEHKELRRVRK